MKSNSYYSTRPEIESEFDDLLHPAHAFQHPRDVVNDRDLAINEKRAILASWASDACAVEAVPALRHPPGTGQVVAVDEILDALRALDRLAQTEMPEAARRQIRRERISEFRGRRVRDPGSGSGLAE
jgi:hypothetical protein